MNERTVDVFIKGFTIAEPDFDVIRKDLQSLFAEHDVDVNVQANINFVLSKMKPAEEKAFPQQYLEALKEPEKEYTPEEKETISRGDEYAAIERRKAKQREWYQQNQSREALDKKGLTGVPTKEARTREKRVIVQTTQQARLQSLRGAKHFICQKCGEHMYSTHALSVHKTQKGNDHIGRAVSK